MVLQISESVMSSCVHFPMVNSAPPFVEEKLGCYGVCFYFYTACLMVVVT
jgi:hypothetical protein